MLNELSNEIHHNAEQHGFYDGKTNVDPMVITDLLLIHAEIAEATEAYRHGVFAYPVLIEPATLANDEEFSIAFKYIIKDSFEDEIADTIIRLLDLCGYMKINIDYYVKMKMKYNKNREYRHGKQF